MLVDVVAVQCSGGHEMRAFLYDRYGDCQIYTNVVVEQQVRDLKTTSRMPLYTKLIISGDRKRRVFHKEADGRGKEQIFERDKSGWREIAR
jgi:hypothetical protein